MRSLPVLAVIVSIFVSLAPQATWAQAVASRVRIVNAIDENSLVTLKGNTHPLASARNDRGRVSPDLPMTGLVLVLRRSAEQQAAFDKFVAAQYDPKSPDFHRWLAPEEVGADFGPSPADIATVSNWLTGHGFSIDGVSPNRMTIRFGGVAAQVEGAFHTEIHNLEVKGEAHIGNMTDPKIPSALAQVVVGVKSLHNFFPRPLHRLGSQVNRDPATGKWQRIAVSAAESTTGSGAQPGRARPQFGINVPASGGNSALQLEDVSPFDFATIYNVLPLWNAGTPINGTGQTIAIAGTSDICLGQTDPACLYNGSYNNDVANFRSTFGLPAYTAANQPTAVSGNNTALRVCTAQSGACTINDLIENSIDVEWAGAVAPGAKIILVASYPNSPSDDPLYDSESYIVDNKTASIMNSSYGLCELYAGTAGNVDYYNLWQTAYSEGIAVFVASGDGGSSECDDGQSLTVGNPYSAQYGLSVNGLASTPFNTAVGGTDFNWCSLTSTSECTPAPYWNATNAANGSSAAGYVPEVPWNDTCANPLTVPFLENWATSSYANDVGGVTDPESGCNFVYNNYLTVDFNAGVTLEYIVDTIGGAGGASGCVTNDGIDVSSCSSSTTSTGTLEGSIPLVNDGWPKPGWQTGVSGIPSDGVRDLPDISFFAATGYLSGSSYLICVSAVDAGNAPCTYSANSEPANGLEVGGTSVASPAMAGVMALINQKAGATQGNPNAELYNLASQQNYGSCSAESVTTSGSCLFNDIDTGTNAMPCDYGADEGGQPGTGILSPNCSVIHSGDGIGILPGYSAGKGYDQATGLGSLNVANVVNAWPVATGTASATVTVSPASSTLSASTPLSVPVTVASSPSGGATPTGTVAVSGGGYSSSVEKLVAGAYSFSIPANSLTQGSQKLTVTYSGDSTYASSTGSASVTVSAPLPTPTVIVIPSPNPLPANTALSVAVEVVAPSGGSASPSGTVTVSGGGYTSPAQALSGGIYTFTVPANTFVAGSYTFTVTYSGDTNYSTATGTSSVEVTSALATATVKVTPGSASVSANLAFSVVVAVAGPTAGSPTPTGSVTLASGGYSATSNLLPSGSYSFTIPANGLDIGTDTLTATYSGDSNYAKATGTASVTVTALPAPTVAVTPTPSSLSASGTLSVAVTLTPPSGSSATPTGTVTLSGGGYTSPAQTLATGAYTFAVPANSLSVGSDTLTVAYSGDTNYASATGTANVTVTAALAIPTVTATPTPSSLSASSTLSVAVTVAPPSGSSATPTGTVTLSGGGYTSAAETLASGAYTFAVPANSLSAGTDTLTVAYSGDTNYANASGTTQVTVTAASGTFTLTATTPASVAAGSSTSSTVTATATGGYTGTATLTCALTTSPTSAVDLPTCALSSTTVDFSTSSSTNVTATISTTAASTAQLVIPGGRGTGSHGKGWLGGGGAVLAFLVFLGIPARRRSWRSMLGALLLLAALGSLSACGDFWQAPSGNSAAGTTSGAYTFTVSGTGSPAVTTVTTTFQVTVN